VDFGCLLEIRVSSSCHTGVPSPFDAPPSSKRTALVNTLRTSFLDFGHTVRRYDAESWVGRELARRAAPSRQLVGRQRPAAGQSVQYSSRPSPSSGFGHVAETAFTVREVLFVTVYILFTGSAQ